MISRLTCCLCGALGVMLPLGAQAVTPQDAAVWFAFTNDTGAVDDGSGHGNIGTVGASATIITNGGPTLPSGRTIGAAEFSGANVIANSIVINDSPSMDFDKNEMTIVFWTRLDSLPDRLSFVKTSNFNVKTDGVNLDGFDLQKHSNGRSPSDLFVSPKGQNYLYNTTNRNTMVPGEWLHVAIAWNWTGTNVIRYYLNGTTNTGQAWFNNNAHPSPQNMTTADWYLGWDPVSLSFTSSGRPLDGRLADFAVFTNTLTEPEIFSIYSNGVAYGSAAPAPQPEATILIVR